MLYIEAELIRPGDAFWNKACPCCTMNKADWTCYLPRHIDEWEYKPNFMGWKISCFCGMLFMPEI